MEIIRNPNELMKRKKYRGCVERIGLQICFSSGLLDSFLDELSRRYIEIKKIPS